MSYLSLTTWSLHRNLGPLRMTVWDDVQRTQRTDLRPQPELLTLLELPAILAGRGFQAIEICHFHIPDTSEAYLQRLKQAITQAGLRFYTLLLDYGDISSADTVRREADIRFMKSWIDRAALAGAERVRIVGGDAAPDDRDGIRRSIDGLQELIRYAAERNVRIITENFHALTSTAENCLTLLDECGDMGLTSDFGNFKGERKYDELALTVPRSESIHAKARTDAQGLPDAEEFERCLQVVKRAGYEGPITLVYDGPDDMWAGIERVRELVAPYLTATP